MHVQNTVNQTVLLYATYLFKIFEPEAGPLTYLYYGFTYVVLNNMVL